MTKQTNKPTLAQAKAAAARIGRRANEADQNNVPDALLIGEFLLALRPEVVSGQWEKTLAELEVNRMTAHRYMYAVLGRDIVTAGYNVPLRELARAGENSKLPELKMEGNPKERERKRATRARKKEAALVAPEPPPEPEPPKLIGWAQAMADRGVLRALGLKHKHLLTDNKAKWEERLGRKIPSRITPEEVDVLAKAFIGLADGDELWREAVKCHAELPDRGREVVEKSIEAWQIALLAKEHARDLEREAELRAEKKKAAAREASFQNFVQKELGQAPKKETVGVIIDRKEFRIVRSCLHPDRCRPDQSELFTQALAYLNSSIVYQ